MPYQLEHKRTVDSTWTVDSSTLTAGQFPVTISGLNPSTSYDVRCLARDASGNVSAYSATSQASTQAAPDTTAPTAPVITTTQTGSASMSTVLTTPSTDIGGSGVATYRLEYKRTIDSTFILDSATLTAASFPRTISGLVPATQYDTRARATDVAGNVGAFSSISQTTTAGTSDPLVWTVRSAGSFYANNFGTYADRNALIASLFDSGDAKDGQLDLETANVLTGKACRMTILKTDGEGTARYRHSFDGLNAHTKSVVKKKLYYQYAVFIPRYLWDHRFQADSGAHELKTAIIQAPDASFATGEIVVTGASFRKFVTSYTVAGPFYEARSPTPGPGAPDYAWQNAIDAGPQSEAGQTDATSIALYKRRYGPMNYMFTATTNYGSTLSSQGNPEIDADAYGISWQPDAWNVIEVWVDQDAQSLKIWHSLYGYSPRLVLSYIGTATLIGGNTDNYTGVQLLPRTEGALPDATRQDTYALYADAIASDNFISFPTSKLALACAALTPGQSVAFTAPVNTWGEGAFEWQTRFHHDEKHNLIHLLGKTANNASSWQHQIYNVLTDTWTDVTSTSGISSWSFNGHIYGNFSMDYETGDLFQSVDFNGSKQVKWWRYASNWQSVVWGVAPVNAANVFAQPLEQFANGLAYHPNLFGSGDGGYCFDDNHRIVCWRKSTDDATFNISHTMNAYGNNSSGTSTADACYWPFKNFALLGIGPYGKITGGATPTLTTVAAAPIATGGYSNIGGMPYGSMHVHPSRPDRLIITATSSGNSQGNDQRAWISNQDATSWSALTASPFTLSTRVVCSLRGHTGCMWGVGKVGSTQMSILWKPPPS